MTASQHMGLGASHLARSIRAIAVVATFALIGPPVGGLVTWMSMGVAAMLRVARVFVPASIVASLVCWFLTRRLLTP